MITNQEIEIDKTVVRKRMNGPDSSITSIKKYLDSLKTKNSSARDIALINKKIAELR